MATLIDTLYDQHRRMFTLLSLLGREVDAFAEGGAFDIYVVEGALDYVAEYPDRLHRPIELRVYEAYRQHQGGNDPLATAAAAAEHEGLSAQARELKNAIVAVGRNAQLSRDLVAAKARRLIDELSRHMTHEENAILPAARAALSDDELAAIRKAVQQNSNAPSFEAEEKTFTDIYDTVIAQDRLGLIARSSRDRERT